MYRYLLGIGSNINPEVNIVCIINEFLGITRELHISSIIKTDPVSVDGGFFLNMCASFSSGFDRHRLKNLCNGIETRLGRDRSMPDKKKLSRTADIDILFNINAGETEVDSAMLPVEPYLRPVALELLSYLGLMAGREHIRIENRFTLTIEEKQIGCAPLTLYRHSGSLNITSGYSDISRTYTDSNEPVN